MKEMQAKCHRSVLICERHVDNPGSMWTEEQDKRGFQIKLIGFNEYHDIFDSLTRIIPFFAWYLFFFSLSLSISLIHILFL